MGLLNQIEKEKEAVSSPSTTLSCFPSDHSDGNSDTDKNKLSLAKGKNDLRVMDFIHLYELVKRELKNATHKYESNVFLRDMKQEIKDGMVSYRRATTAQCSNACNPYLLDEVSYRRATAAQARQRRMRIYRAKKKNNK